MQRETTDRAMRALIAWALVTLGSGCAPTLDTPNDGPDGGDEVPGGPMINEAQADGTTITRVNATDDGAFLYIDLESQAVVTVSSPESSGQWDIGFRRFNIKINGGVSGAGDMQIAGMFDTAFESVTRAPDTGWVTDEVDSPVEDGGDENEDPDYAFVTGDTRWFSYNPANHVLTPLDVVYAVRTVEQSFYKLRFISYYDQVGTPGFISFQWGPIDSP